MNTRWRFKAYLAFFFIFFSVYLLIPTVLDFRLIREDAELKGDSPPWYVKLFPDKQLNLGLDLRGGIYLELDVNLQDALVQRSQITAGEIDRFLRDKNIGYQQVSVLPKTTIVAVRLNQSDDLPTVRNHVRDFYGNAFQEIKTPPLLIYQLKAGDEGSRLSTYQAVVAWAQGQKGILDVILKTDRLEIVLEDSKWQEELNAESLAKFGELLHAAPDPIAIYLQQTEVYQDRLKDETVRQAVNTIRNRIDRHGVAEPSIQQQGENRVVIELPGVKDPERAIALVKKAGKLEFKLVDESVPDPKVQELVNEVRRDQGIPEGFSFDIVDRINNALKGRIPAESEIAYEVQYDPITKKITGGTPFLLRRQVEVSGEMLSNAQVSVQNNEPYVSLSFNPSGTQIFADVTAANVGKRLAILLDGTVNKAPVIKSAIPSGEAQITLGYGDYQTLLREAEDLVVVLRVGALPATLSEATKTVIGPTLGKSSIQRGFKATLLAALVVTVFMAVWYKWSGVVADFALMLNVLFIFGILTLFGATLTLPGVAGIVLTLGMAVDANVIILERIRDELGIDRPVRAAVEAGYGNAMSAVIDSNITTFLSGVVLYQFGTGPVRGFAVTLMVGIVTTMFTAIVITRLVYDYALFRWKDLKLSL